MITYFTWNDVMENDMIEILLAIILTFFTIPLDVLLLPIEVIALIIYELSN